MPTTVKIGMDQWVVCGAGAGTTLYTAGLSGCVAVALFSETHTALTHVASTAHKAWRNYAHELDLMWIVSNVQAPVTKAVVMAVGRTHMPPYTDVIAWLEAQKVASIVELTGNGMLVSPDGVVSKQEALSRDVQNKGYRRLFEPEAWAAITNQGKLSDEAAMPSKAQDGVAENEDDFD